MAYSVGICACVCILCVKCIYLAKAYFGCIASLRETEEYDSACMIFLNYQSETSCHTYLHLSFQGKVLNALHVHVLVYLMVDLHVLVLVII